MRFVQSGRNRLRGRGRREEEREEEYEQRKKRKRRIRGRTTGRESESLMTHRSKREEGEVRNTLKWPITCDRGRYTNLPARSLARPASLSLCAALIGYWSTERDSIGLPVNCVMAAQRQGHPLRVCVRALFNTPPAPPPPQPHLIFWWAIGFSHPCRPPRVCVFVCVCSLHLKKNHTRNDSSYNHKECCGVMVM